MTEMKPLSICNLETAVILYRDMIEECQIIDPRLKNVNTDSKPLRNMLQPAFDIENSLFFILYVHGAPAGFIDSARVETDGGPDAWYIKSLYLLPGYRERQYYAMMEHRIEREVRQRGIMDLFSTVLIGDDETDSLWEDLGYTLETDKRTKNLAAFRAVS